MTDKKGKTIYRKVDYNQRNVKDFKEAVYKDISKKYVGGKEWADAHRKADTIQNTINTIRSQGRGKIPELQRPTKVNKRGIDLYSIASPAMKAKMNAESWKDEVNIDKIREQNNYELDNKVKDIIKSGKNVDAINNQIKEAVNESNRRMNADVDTYYEKKGYYTIIKPDGTHIYMPEAGKEELRTSAKYNPLEYTRTVDDKGNLIYTKKNLKEEVPFSIQRIVANGTENIARMIEHDATAMGVGGAYTGTFIKEWDAKERKYKSYIIPTMLGTAEGRQKAKEFYNGLLKANEKDEVPLSAVLQYNAQTGQVNWFENAMNNYTAQALIRGYAYEEAKRNDQSRIPTESEIKKRMKNYDKDAIVQTLNKQTAENKATPEYLESVKQGRMEVAALIMFPLAAEAAGIVFPRATMLATRGLGAYMTGEGGAAAIAGQTTKERDMGLIEGAFGVGMMMSGLKEADKIGKEGQKTLTESEYTRRMKEISNREIDAMRRVKEDKFAEDLLKEQESFKKYFEKEKAIKDAGFVVDKDGNVYNKEQYIEMLRSGMNQAEALGKFERLNENQANIKEYGTTDFKTAEQVTQPTYIIKEEPTRTIINKKGQVGFQNPFNQETITVPREEERLKTERKTEEEIKEAEKIGRIEGELEAEKRTGEFGYNYDVGVDSIREPEISRERIEEQRQETKQAQEEAKIEEQKREQEQTAKQEERLEQESSYWGTPNLLPLIPPRLSRAGTGVGGAPESPEERPWKIRAETPIILRGRNQIPTKRFFIEEQEAVDEGMRIVDETPDIAFTTRQQSVNERKIRKGKPYKTPFKFIKKGNTYIEKPKYRHDSPGEKRGRFNIYPYLYGDGY